MNRVEFADALLLTDAIVDAPSQLSVVRIPRIRSAEEYSLFILERLADFISTSHCLIVQWDGFVLDSSRWDPAFLQVDYIGAPWPQFADDRNVGNGGFSLRSRKLLDACRQSGFRKHHPEDVAVCRTNRDLLESELGIKFANRLKAERFSFERTHPTESTFGFHGVFNMIPALGVDKFLRVYNLLDDRSTAFVDYGLLMSQFLKRSRRISPVYQLTKDKFLTMFD